MKKLVYGSTVHVIYRNAIYLGTYKGVDNFERKKTHLVNIQKLDENINVQDNEVFQTKAELEKKYPNHSLTDMTKRSGVFRT